MESLADLLNKAVALHNAGRLDQAERLYREVLRANPRHGQALALLGEIARRSQIPVASASTAPSDVLLGELARQPERQPPAAEQGGNIVLGAAFGYDAAKIAPFALSLREHHAGAVTLFVDSPALGPFLDRHGIGFEVHDKADQAMHVVQARFVMALRHLLRHGHRYRRALLTDVGDVVFQADPFALGRAPALVSFQEHPTLTLDTQPTNARWMTQFFGADALSGVFSGKPVVCVGVTLGDTQAVVAYLRMLLAIAALTGRERIKEFGCDTAVHNFIVHLKLIEGFEIDGCYRHCAHLGTADPATVWVDERGFIRVKPDYRPAIVHQYNYGHQAAIDLIARKYRV